MATRTHTPAGERSLSESRAAGFRRLGGGRLRTAIGFLIALAALSWVGSRLDIAAAWVGIRSADWRWFLLGFALFYLTLPLRALRWRILLANAGDPLPLRALMSAVFRAWFFNCALPGRGGDLYSAYFLRREYGLSLVKTGGTIFTARVLDLVTLTALLAWIFLSIFRGRLPAVFDSLVFSGLGLAGVLILGLALLALMRERVAARLPERFGVYLLNFTSGIFGSLGRLPLLIASTLALWLLEAARLWCVLAAIGSVIAPLKVVFLALAAAIATILPFTPGGLGTVEALFTELFPRLGIPTLLTGSAIFLDRFINYWFILLAGLVYFLLGRLRAPNPRQEEHYAR